LTSCASKQALLSKLTEPNKIKLLGKIVDIEIIDKRINTSLEKIKIPMISFPGESDRISPVLTEGQKQLITNKIRSYFITSDFNVNIKCYILTGFKEFTAHTWHEKEYVEFEAKIELLDENNILKKEVSQKVVFEAKSMDASQSYLDKIYEKAINTAIYKCFDQLQK
jgi:hypothetical protein